MDDKKWTRTKNWGMYSLFWTIAPILVIVIPSWFAGIDLDIPEILPDYILVVFAVSVNLMSCRAEFPSQISKNRRSAGAVALLAGLVAFGGMFLLGILYLSFYNVFQSEEIIKKLTSSGTPFMVLCIGTSVFLLVDAELGIALKMFEDAAATNICPSESTANTSKGVSAPEHQKRGGAKK